jgi:hypothetical protein
MTSPIEPGTAVVGVYLGVPIAGTVSESRPHTINHAAWLVSVDLDRASAERTRIAGYGGHGRVTCWVGYDGKPASGSDGSWLELAPKPRTAGRVERPANG